LREKINIVRDVTKCIIDIFNENKTTKTKQKHICDTTHRQNYGKVEMPKRALKVYLTAK
jgi:hypothetical protein